DVADLITDVDARSLPSLSVNTSYMTYLVAYLSFQSYGDHPATHSFPTRRSSDLQRRADLRVSSLRGRADRAGGRGHRVLLRLLRSEEHTSELQSHLNLVCRLLLEKKNDLTAHAHGPASTGPCVRAGRLHTRRCAG